MTRLAGRAHPVSRCHCNASRLFNYLPAGAFRCDSCRTGMGPATSIEPGQTNFRADSSGRDPMFGPYYVMLRRAAFTLRTHTPFRQPPLRSYHTLPHSLQDTSVTQLLYQLPTLPHPPGRRLPPQLPNLLFTTLCRTPNSRRTLCCVPAANASLNTCLPAIQWRHCRLPFDVPRAFDAHYRLPTCITVCGMRTILTTSCHYGAELVAGPSSAFTAFHLPRSAFFCLTPGQQLGVGSGQRTATDTCRCCAAFTFCILQTVLVA